MTKEQFKETNFKMSYEEYCKCDCTFCTNACIHKEAFRRFPECDGGLGLCPNLKKKVEKKYTTASLFGKIVEILKDKGFYPDDILDYGNACSWKDVPIITEAWSPVFKLDYGGSEGIYLDVAVKGNITNPDKEEVISIGTFKTLLESDEAMLKMAELQAHFIIELYKFVNDNMDDFTWYGGDVRILSEGKLTGYLSCGSLEKAFENAIRYNKEHSLEGKTAIVRDNATRKWYYENKKEYRRKSNGLD